MNTKIILQIEDLLEELLVFDERATSALMKRIPNMTQKGLMELLKTLKAGQVEQNNMIETWVKREPDFAKKLTKFVDKTSKSLFEEHEKVEQSSADTILKELE